MLETHCAVQTQSWPQQTSVCFRLVQHFIANNKHVKTGATTGCAATRLTSLTPTAHSLFHIFNNGLPPLHSTHPKYLDLLRTDVFIIDEYSMLKAEMLNCIIYRLLQVHKLLNDKDSLFDKVCHSNHYSTGMPTNTGNVTGHAHAVHFVQVLILLVGDMYQLPPVCTCRQRSSTSQDADDTVAFCQTCHITSSMYWSRAQHHSLTASVRHAKDLPFLSFLNLIRTTKPTQQQIDDSIGHCRKPEVRKFTQCLLQPSIAHLPINRKHSWLCRAMLWLIAPMTPKLSAHIVQPWKSSMMRFCMRYFPLRPYWTLP